MLGVTLYASERYAESLADFFRQSIVSKAWRKKVIFGQTYSKDVQNTASVYFMVEEDGKFPKYEGHSSGHSGEKFKFSVVNAGQELESLVGDIDKYFGRFDSWKT